MYSREEFEQRRTVAKRLQRTDLGYLVVASVGLGLGQLGFIAWAEAHLIRGTAVRLEGIIFLLYIALVLWLGWRSQRHQLAAAPRCPRCGRALVGMSRRLAVATGHCDACGAQVLS